MARTPRQDLRSGAKALLLAGLMGSLGFTTGCGIDDLGSIFGDLFKPTTKTSAVPFPGGEDFGRPTPVYTGSTFGGGSGGGYYPPETTYYPPESTYYPPSNISAPPIRNVAVGAENAVSAPPLQVAPPLPQTPVETPIQNAVVPQEAPPSVQPEILEAPGTGWEPEPTSTRNPGVLLVNNDRSLPRGDIS